MKCPSCGTTLEEGATRCSFCGAAVQPGRKQDAPWSQAPGQAAPAPFAAGEITRNEFYRSYASNKVRKNIKSSAILCYVCAAITAIAGFVLLQNPMVLVDVAIVLVLGLGIHLKQSRVCAILLLAYSVLSCLLTIISYGKASGWLIILAGVYAVINTFALEKEYRAYQNQ